MYKHINSLNRVEGRIRWRSERGQAIAEGAAIMPLMITLAVFMILFLLYVGATLYYYTQLSFVANQVAMYEAEKLPGDGTPPDTNDMMAKANELLALMNLPAVGKSFNKGPASGATVSIAYSGDMTSNVGIQLSMSGISILKGQIPSFPIIGNGAALISPNPKFKYFATLQVMNTNCGKDISVNVPCYEAYGQWPQAGFATVFDLGRTPQTLTRVATEGVNAGGGVWGGIKPGGFGWGPWEYDLDTTVYLTY